MSSDKKRSPPPFIQFLKRYRESEAKAASDEGRKPKAQPEIAKLASADWNGMTQEEKKPFVLMCDQERGSVSANKAGADEKEESGKPPWVNSYLPSDWVRCYKHGSKSSSFHYDLKTGVFSQKRPAISKRGGKKRGKNTSGWWRFMRQFQRSLPTDEQKKVVEVAKRAGEKWRMLSAEEKAAYADAAKADAEP